MVEGKSLRMVLPYKLLKQLSSEDQVDIQSFLELQNAVF